MGDMYETFKKYFELVIADEPELLQKTYQMRFQVMSDERHYSGFDPLLYPDGLESDEYDVRSSHILLRYISTGNFIGTARLVFPDPMCPDGLFPLESYTQIDPLICDITKLPRQRTAEISRFFILNKFDRRRRERRDFKSRRNVGISAQSNWRRFPSFALAIGILCLGAKHNVTNLLSMMDPAVNRLLSNIGMNSTLIGPSFDFYGPRRPYILNLVDVLNKIHREHNDIWKIVTDGIKDPEFFKFK